jgi:hypothetical protein
MEYPPSIRCDRPHLTKIPQIALYEPACLIVGTRGRSLGGIQGLLPGSVSKYCLQNSPVPVIVVRPSAKREKKKRKRRADPTRRSYMDILEKSGAKGVKVLDRIDGEGAGIGEEEMAKEADAVAKALGVSTTSPAFVEIRRESNSSTPVEGPDDGSSEATLTRVTSQRSEPESPSPTGGLSPDARFVEEVQSPESEVLESPEETSEEDGSEESVERDLFGSHKPRRSSDSLKGLGRGGEDR